MSDPVRLVWVTVLALVTFAFVVSFGVLAADDALAALLLVLGTIALLAVVRAGRASAEPEAFSAFDEALRTSPDRPRRAAELARLELDLALSAQHEGHLRSRVVPVVREIADARAIARAEARPGEVEAFLEEPTLRSLRAALDALETT